MQHRVSTRRRLLATAIILLALTSCSLDAPPEAARIIATGTAEALRPTLVPPTVVPSASPRPPTAVPTTVPPTATVVPASATPEATVAPAAVVLPQPTATPLFPDQIIGVDTLPRLHPLRQIGYGRARHAVIAPGNRLLAVATDGGIAWFELPSLQHLRFDQLEGGVSHLAFGPDGHVLAVELPLAGDNRQQTTLLWRVADSKQLLKLEDATPIFSSDGRFIAAAQDNKVHVWRADDGKQIGTLTGQAPVFSPDGQLIATTSTKGVTLWRSSDQRKVVVLPGAAGAIFSLDGQLIATEKNQATTLWRNDGTEVTQLSGGDPLFSPNGQLLATHTDAELHLWHLPDARAIAQIPMSSTNLQVRFSADSQLLHVSGWDIGAQTWSVSNGQLVSSFKGIVGDVMELSPFGGMLSVVSAGGDAPAFLRLARTADGTMLHEDGVSSGPTMWGSEASFSLDDTMAAVVTLDGLVQVLDASTGKSLELDLTGYTQFAFSPDGRQLAAGRGGPLLDLWRVSDCTLEQTQGNESEIFHTLHGLTFTSDGRTLVAEHEQLDWVGRLTTRETLSWDVASGNAPAVDWQMNVDDTNSSEPHAPLAWAFSPPNNLAAWVDNDGQTRLKGSSDVTTTVTTVITATALTFNPDGSLLAVGDEGGAVQLVGTGDGVISDTLQVGGAVASIRFSPDGTLVGAQRSDGPTFVWRVGTSEPIARLTSPPAARLIFSPDNTLAILGGAHGVSFYDLDDGKLLQTFPVAASDIAIGPAQRLLGVLRDGRIELWGVQP